LKLEGPKIYLTPHNNNGMQINGILLVGVKLLDPMRRHALNERLDN